MEWSKLESWEVQNFASIEHGRCEFDESGIISIVGYNDSGKSNMVRALDVLMFNSHQKSQLLFIMDGKDYFRVTAKFSDGVIILRDKYINGQSLYEMYKDGECVYSSRVNGVLTKVDSVPDPISMYLGLSEELTIRTCYDKQFAVQTSGSENYRSMSTELRTEELVKAGELINADKNKLGTDIVSKRNFLLVHQEIVASGENFTEGLIQFLEKGDKKIDLCGACENDLVDMDAIQASIDALKIPPELDAVDMTKLHEIGGIVSTSNAIDGIVIPPETSDIDSKSLELLSNLNSVCDALSGIVITPELGGIDSDGIDLLKSTMTVQSKLQDINVFPELSLLESDRLFDLAHVMSLCVEDEPVQPEVSFLDDTRLAEIVHIQSLADEMPDISEITAKIDELHDEMVELAKQVGTSVVVCPECGYLITDENAHVHV